MADKPENLEALKPNVSRIIYNQPYNKHYNNAHHRTKNIIKEYSINIPDNIKVIEPVGYFKMIELISQCRGIVSDSGGVTKISPIFGKKSIIPLNTNEWNDLLDYGYAKLGMDLSWILDDYSIKPKPDLYLNNKACEIIASTITSMET